MAKKNTPPKQSLNEQKLPVIPIRGMVLFPLIKIPFFIGRKKSLNALQLAMYSKKMLFTVTQKNATIEQPNNDQLFSVGVVGRIVKVTKLPNDTVKIIFEVVARGKIQEFIEDDNLQQVKFTYLADPIIENKKDTEAYIALIKEQFTNYLQRKQLPQKQPEHLILEKDPLNLSYRIIPYLEMDINTKQKLLEMDSIDKILNEIYLYLIHDEQKFKIAESINQKIKSQITHNQKEQYLQEQLHAIQKELGQDTKKSDLDEIKDKLKAANLPSNILVVANKEIKKLQNMPFISSEASMVRQYLDLLIDLPWQKTTKDNNNLRHVQQSLTKDHYGLLSVKDRIIEYIALIKRTNSIKGSILCFIGPPGVGKTSLARSIANALNRKFIRMSLGGIRDEAEIRGHRRTYVGAIPGRIISAIRKAGTSNPVILLDEIDKLSNSNLGNPSAALLEALDPEQNNSFIDHYLEIEYDLSKVIFICTANNRYDIPPALDDRMEVVELGGYSLTEKKHILSKHLLPKQLLEHGLDSKEIKLNKNMFSFLINSYTKEAGIRELERVLQKILRKTNRELLQSKKIKKITLDKQKIQKYIGPPIYTMTMADKSAQIGIVNGLAWTNLGGDLLLIEAFVIEGSGKLILTGKLGEVMQESAQAALSYVRANCDLFGINSKLFKTMDIHIHAPAGAVPKDGPSAGVSLVTAIVSALTKIAVRNDVALTGEISLRGKILPVGGLKEKMLAAMRAKIKTVLIPDNNVDTAEFDPVLKADLKSLKILKFKDIYPLVCTALVSKPKALSEKIAPSSAIAGEENQAKPTLRH